MERHEVLLLRTAQTEAKEAVGMATKRKDTLVAPREWAKHLRPFNKRMQAKAERRAAKHEITERMEEIYRAAELGRGISFRNAIEARLYRECYVRTHMGVIDVKEERKQLRDKTC